MSKVSIILPNYNHSLYLPLRIDSILNQTFPDYELIILDDFSTDNSRDIIERYRNHPRVTSIIYNEKNSGSTFFQWEKGIQLAKGKYIWIAESDDFSDNNFLSKIIQGLESKQGVGLAFCASNITDKDNNVTSRNYNYDERINQLLSENFVMSGKEFCEQYLFFTCVIVNASSVVFEKKLYNQVSQDFKTYKVSGDWRMWVDICYDTNIFYLNESLNYFRYHTNNVRTNKVSLMNEEAMFNYMASCKKTSSKTVQQKLKSQLFKHWCFEFSRGMKTFRFRKSIQLMFKIIKIDYAFFFRGIHHLYEKAFQSQSKKKSAIG